MTICVGNTHIGAASIARLTSISSSPRGRTNPSCLLVEALRSYPPPQDLYRPDNGESSLLIVLQKYSIQTGVTPMYPSELEYRSES
jgi:hypothetical protein